jgi:hypothetical protein
MKCCSVGESLFQSAALTERSISLAVQKDALAFLYIPQIVVLDGEEDKAMRICLEERFMSKMAFNLGSLVLRYFALQRQRLLGFPCGTGSVREEFIPIITIVPDEVCDLAEGLVRYDVFKRHGRY